MALGADGFNDLLSATVLRIQADLTDQVFTQRPVLAIFKDNLETIRGGTNYQTNIIAGENNSASWTDESGSFDTGKDTDILGLVRYDWSNLLVSKTRLAYKTLEMNQGEAAVTNLLETHIKACTKGHAKKLAQALHKPADSMDVGAILSLDAIFGDATSDDAAVSGAGRLNVGGIDSSAHSYWQSLRVSSVAADIAIEEQLAQTSEDVYTRSDGGKATAVLAGRKAYDEYRLYFNDKVRFDGHRTPKSALDASFGGLEWEGIPVVLDPDGPENRIYMINEPSLIAAKLNDNFMQPQKPQVIPGTLDTVTPMASILLFGTKERRVNAVIDRVYA